MLTHHALHRAIRNYAYRRFSSMIKEYSISGMSCAACSASVERAVRRISGVDAASVNLSTEKLFVRSTNDLSDEIFAAVQKVGFGIAPVVSAKKQSAIDAERRRLDIKKRRSNLILAAVFAIPLFYISMGHIVRVPVPRVHHRTAGFRRYADDSAAARAFCRQSILCARNQGDIRTAPEYGFAYCRRHNCINCLFRLLNRTDIQRTAPYDA